MQDLTSVYLRIKEMEKERKEIKKMFKDELAHDATYQAVLEDLKVLKEKKKSIENEKKAGALNDVARMEQLTLDILGTKELLADICTSRLSKNESLEIEVDGEILAPQFACKMVKDRESESGNEVKRSEFIV